MIRRLWRAGQGGTEGDNRSPWCGGPSPNQSALRGLLERIRDLNITRALLTNDASGGLK